MYWFKYTAFTAAGIPVVWVIVYGTPDWWPAAVRRWFEAQPTMAAPVLLLLLCACVSRFADAGSTATALRGHTLREGAPSLGSSPDYAVLFRLARGQSLALIVLTLALTLIGADIARGALLIVTFVSACAVAQNLLLFLGHSSLPSVPELRTDSEIEWTPPFSNLGDITGPLRERRPIYSDVEVTMHNTLAYERNILARFLEMAAMVGAVIASTALLLWSFLFVWPGRISLLATFIIGSVVLVLIGRVEGRKHREELAALQQEATKKEQLRRAMRLLEDLKKRHKVN